MNVNLSFSEMWYLLESCLRGSHLRTSTIERFVNEFFHMFDDEERVELRYRVLDKIYGGNFVPISSCCEKDVWFMERYDLNNRYSVTINYRGEIKTFDAFKHGNGEGYFTSINEQLNPDYIIKVEQIKYEK